MPEHVRSAIAADAAACLAVYRPYVLDTVITFETEVPTVEEMAARIVAARVMHEWLVLEVAGDVAGYAYAQQFNPRAAYRWSVETSVYMARDRVRTGVGESSTPNCSVGSRHVVSGEHSPPLPNPTTRAMPCTRLSGSSRRADYGGSGGSTGPGTTSSGGSWTWSPARTRWTHRAKSRPEIRRRRGRYDTRRDRLLVVVGDAGPGQRGHGVFAAQQ